MTECGLCFDQRLYETAKGAGCWLYAKSLVNENKITTIMTNSTIEKPD